MTLTGIKQIIESKTGINLLDENNNTHERKCVLKMFCELAKTYTLSSNADIAKFIGKKESTVWYNARKHQELLTNIAYKKIFREIESVLRG